MRFYFQDTWHDDDKGKCSFHESDFTWNLLFEYWIFFNFPPLSQSFIASQLEDVNCTDPGKTLCSSVHILWAVTRILGAEAFLTWGWIWCGHELGLKAPLIVNGGSLNILKNAHFCTKKSYPFGIFWKSMVEQPANLDKLTRSAFYRTVAKCVSKMRSWDTSLKHRGECMVGALVVLVTAPIIHWAAAGKVYYLWAKVIKLCCVLSLFWFCLQLKTLPQTRKYSKQGIELCNEISSHIYQFSEFKVQNSLSYVLHFTVIM